MTSKFASGQEQPRFSVVINTDGRAKALRNTIESFRHLAYGEFEVVVVCGPTPDGTREVGREYAAKGWIKYIECPERNLSQSRNLGIKHASGDIVAFIDDDAIPEPEWLAELAPAFDDPDTGGAGGLVFDQTGYTYQYLYAACDRLGNALVTLKAPAEEYNYPLSARIPYVQGTNGAFRRSVLIDIGGFDEEYEFYLDETDVCCRVVDAGWKIRQLGNAAVHHKFLPSHIRNEHRITTVKYPVIKNKIYFSLVNNRGHYPLARVLEDATRFVASQRADLEFHVGAGRLSPFDLEAFEEDAERALATGLERGLSRRRRTRPADYFGGGDPFKPFPRLVAAGGRRTLVFLSQSYPPAPIGGITRYTHDIARAVGALGHSVHVLTQGQDFNRVDFEEGVWVHRIVPKAQLRGELPDGTVVPERIWNYAATMTEEIYRINRSRPVDAVEGVSWDCEALATMMDGYFPSAVNIVTTLAHWLDTYTQYRDDPKWMAEFGQPMLAAERQLFRSAPGIIAASSAIARSIEERYGVELGPDRVVYLEHGMADMRPLPRRQPRLLAAARPGGGRLSILFVGRLEKRKGIDVLLAAIERLAPRHAEVDFWLAGDDACEIEPGVTARGRFEQANVGNAWMERVRFIGRVDEDELRWLYGNCDVFVAPSRFESFGLILVEAMMFSKPAVGCSTGGMAEVVDDGVTGLLVEPDNVDELVRALETLITERDVRLRLGARGRQEFETRFDVTVGAPRRLAYLASLARRPIEENRVSCTGLASEVEAGVGRKARSLAPEAALEFSTMARKVFITFWKHDWSGIARITVDGDTSTEVDLFSEQGAFTTVTVDVPQGGAMVCVLRTGAKSARSNDSQVIVAAIQEAVGAPFEADPRAGSVSLASQEARHDMVFSATGA